MEWNVEWNMEWNVRVKKTAIFRLEKKKDTLLRLVQLAYCCTQRVESGSGV